MPRVPVTPASAVFAHPFAAIRRFRQPRVRLKYRQSVTITLNGERADFPAPLTVSELLSQLQIDSRRVAVELNLVVLKRATFDTTVVKDGDEVEIVNFVGGG
jgi:sulfur carrier protein